MTLERLSEQYVQAGDLLRARLRELRAALRGSQDPEEQWQLRRRIAVLTEMLRQTNELAELTARYYERGYVRNGKYTL